MPIRDEPASYDVTSSELVYRSGHVIDVRREQVTMPGGDSATRDVVQHPGAVAIIPVDAQDRILLLQQYRHPVRQLPVALMTLLLQLDCAFTALT